MCARNDVDNPKTPSSDCSAGNSNTGMEEDGLLFAVLHLTQAANRNGNIEYLDPHQPSVIGLDQRAAIDFREIENHRPTWQTSLMHQLRAPKRTVDHRPDVERLGSLFNYVYACVVKAGKLLERIDDGLCFAVKYLRVLWMG